MHALFGAADESRPREGDQSFNTLSHGQSFLRYVADPPIGVGLWILDEPEAALSFQSCVALLGVLADLAEEGSQVIMATHSPCSPRRRARRSGNSPSCGICSPVTPGPGRMHHFSAHAQLFAPENGSGYPQRVRPLRRRGSRGVRSSWPTRARRRSRARRQWPAREGPER